MIPQINEALLEMLDSLCLLVAIGRKQFQSVVDLSTSIGSLTRQSRSCVDGHEVGEQTKAN